MAVSKAIATSELVVLLVQFLLANSFLLLRVNPDSDPPNPRLALLGGSLLLTTVAAATILLYVRMALSSVEAKVASIHHSLLTAGSSLQLEAAAAYKQDVAAIRPKLRMLRTLLLVAIAVSAASSLLAFPTLETGYGCGKGCVHSRNPLAVVAMVMMAVHHGYAAFLVASP